VPTPTPLNCYPASFTAGETITVLRSPPGFSPVDGYALTLYLNGAAVLNVVATASGSAFLFTLTPTISGKLLPGTYRFTEFASKGTDRWETARGTLAVQADPREQSAGDATPWAEKTLAVVEAALAGRLTSDMQSYQIANRAVTKIPFGELMSIRNALREEVAAARNGGVFPPVRVLARFPGVESEAGQRIPPYGI
jgi:hypothetical protein